MPSASTITASEKATVKQHLPSGTTKIHTATVARVYYAHPNPNEWSYSGIQGALAFVSDKVRGGFWWRVVDLQGTRGIIWEHEVYEPMLYTQDRPFFHSFAGDDCMIGFSFPNESEALTMYKKFEKRGKLSTGGKAKAQPPAAPSTPTRSKTKSKKGKIDKSLISAPSGFHHVAHMGYDSEGGFTSTGLDPSWQALLESLGQYGVSKNDLQGNEDFIKGFEKAQTQAPTKPPPPAVTPRGGGKKPPPPPAPVRKRGTEMRESISSLPPATPVESTPAPPSSAPPRPPSAPPPRPPSSAPPPPPSAPPPPPTSVPPPPPSAPPPRPMTSAPPPPAAPPPRPPTSAPPPPPAAPPPPAPPASAPPRPPAAPPPPPPAPPVTRGAPPPPPPPPPSGAPPPPPPPPSSAGAPPPPPPPPPPAGAPPPPPPPPGAPPPPPGAPPPPPPGAPPPPPAGMAMPAPQPGRADLLASIQGKGIHSLRKAPPPDEGGSSGAGTAAAAVGGAAVGAAAATGGGDLASALAAALTQRNKAIGDSSDEEEDDDWDD
ncbi:unnamed protein product [Rhizoctonia solani]|uniref:Wiskott-Aldrich syndrome protein n=1 Tax=Rhizoctonia solani TaxID=456999 RepID=A0A8H3H8V2_9AGAM|nr:unnamed protein product [Rhizoctonia solani]CAE6507167.1 unnamed protein product [Rhizoctonia solani]